MEIFATMDINAITTWLIELFSIGALILFLLTAAVNIIVEVFKGLAPKLPTNIMAFGVAIVLTFLAMVIACSVMEISIMWYYAVGAVVMGFFVAHAAMFGFDKFKDTFDKLKALKKP